MSGIVLSSAVRTNLTTLQSTSALQGKIQERLSSGKKVNSALDNVSSFFTASGLNRRASDLSGLLDSMQQGVKTLQAADNAMKAITKNVESMQANIRQARADKSFKSESFAIASNATGNLSFTAGSVTGTVNVQTATERAVLTGGAYQALDFRGDGLDATANTVDDTNGTLAFDLALNGGAATRVSITSTADNNLSITVGTTTVATNAVADADAVSDAELVSTLNAGLNAASAGVTASVSGGAIRFTANTDKGMDPGTASLTVTNAAVTGSGGANLTTTRFGYNVAGTGTTTAGPAKTVDQLVSTINNHGALSGRVKASNDGGKLKVENLSTEALTVGGINAVNGEIQGTAGLGTKSIGGNDVRKGLINQFNDLRKQLDRMSDDASYNGINLLKADKLKVTFNETGTSSVEIQAKDVRTQVARGISTASDSLNVGEATATEFGSDASLDARLEALSKSLTTLQTQSSEFGAALTTVQNRQDFTKDMINTLQTGADSLVLADANEEAAKLLALNTRQQLSQTALSLASQADQAVLRLF